MKNITKFALLTLGTIACSLSVIRAEDTTPTPAGGPPPEHREGVRQRFKERGDRIAKELDLTEAQNAQMKTLGEEQRAAADTVRADAALTPEQKKDKVAQLWQDFQAKRQALLTPEQKVKADSMKEKFKDRWQNGTQGGPAGGPPTERGERIAKELGLTPDQHAQMKSLAKDQQAAADAVRADASLTPEQKQQKVKQLRQDFQTKRQALLTPEQRQKAESMKGKFKEHGRHHGPSGEPEAAK